MTRASEWLAKAGRFDVHSFLILSKISCIDRRKYGQFVFVTREVIREIMTKLGVITVNEMVGRTDLLKKGNLTEREENVYDFMLEIMIWYL